MNAAMIRCPRWAWLTLLVLELSGFCGSMAWALVGNGLPGESLTQRARADVSEKARLRPNPLADDPRAPAAGAQLYARHCADCHGKDAEGGPKGPALRSDVIRSATPGTLFWILTNGSVRRGMPVWSKLPEPQRWQIVTFLKSLSPPGDRQP